MPDTSSPLLQPPYSPECNPVENIWQLLRQSHLAKRVFKTYDDIVKAACIAWNALIAAPTTITSTATRQWAAGQRVGRLVYPGHAIIRNSVGSMTRKLSVT